MNGKKEGDPSKCDINYLFMFLNHKHTQQQHIVSNTTQVINTNEKIYYAKFTFKKF